MDPFVGSTLMDLGGGILSWLGGRGKEKRLRGQYEGDRGMVKGMMGKQPFDPYSIAAMTRRYTAGDRQAMGGAFDRRMGLDTGQGQGALAEQMLGGNRDMLARLMEQSKMAQFGRDSDLARMLFGASSQLYGGA